MTIKDDIDLMFNMEIVSCNFYFACNTSPRPLSHALTSPQDLTLRLRGGGKIGRDTGRSQRQHKPYKTPQDEPVSRGVFCGNLSYETTWQTLKDHMRQAGEVTRADVLIDRATGRSKGCGIVEYEDAADARKAIRDLHETELDGRQIFLREDREEGGGGGSHAAMSIDRPLASSRFGSQQDGHRVYVGNLSWGTFQKLSQGFDENMPCLFLTLSYRRRMAGSQGLHAKGR